MVYDVIDALRAVKVPGRFYRCVTQDFRQRFDAAADFFPVAGETVAQQVARNVLLTRVWIANASTGSRRSDDSVDLAGTQKTAFGGSEEWSHRIRRTQSL